MLTRQLDEALQGLSESALTSLVVAYEPVWAIGTGLSATAEMAQETHQWMRQMLETHFSAAFVEKLALLYGGSVKPNNTAELIRQRDIDGLLVGGASLSAEEFRQICAAAAALH